MARVKSGSKGTRPIGFTPFPRAKVFNGLSHLRVEIEFIDA